jgi:mono/diheme cytochrome c family protein
MTGTPRPAGATKFSVHPPRSLASLVGALLATALVVITAACAADSGTQQALSPEAMEGRRLYNSQGCSGCHGANGSGGVGPPMVGLHMTERELTDGRTVTADEEYLARAITDPRADIVAGYSLPMPSNRLNDEQVAAIVSYIKELGTNESESPS